MEAIGLPKPILEVTMAGVNVTADIAGFVESLVYQDSMEDDSDSLEITLDNSDDRWLNDWYPTQGDQITAKISLDGQSLDCGTFEIDECEAINQGCQFIIKSLATGVSKSTRTQTSVAYDDTTLQQVAETVADKHQLTLVGTIDHIPIGRVTQVNETDLAFLKRIGQRFGYVFNVKGDQLIFHHGRQIQAQPAAMTIYRHQAQDWNLKAKLLAMPNEATIAFTPVATGESVKATVGNTFDASADSLHIVDTAENEQQAQVMAQAALDRETEQRVTGDITLLGDVNAVAGAVINLSGFGRLDDQCIVKQSRHTVSRVVGWEVSLQLKATA